jgi:transcriptional regulator with XRE-family HTH domain
MLNENQVVGEEILPDTIAENLRVYNIAAKIKRLRLRKSIGLAELGRHTSLSPAMLSKLENGHVIPTLQTLTRIALVFSVGLDYFFSSEDLKKATIVRAEERQQFPETMGGKEPVYLFQCLDFKAVDRKSSAFIADFKPNPPEDVPTHQHEGSEFVHVLSGTLGIKIDGQESQIQTGDSIYFDPSLPHGYRQIGKAPCRAIVFTVP